MFGKVMEAPELRLGDGTAKIFYNCCYKGKDIPEGLGNLYDYIETGHAGSTLTKRIDEAVVRGRRNEMRCQTINSQVLFEKF